MRLIEPKPSNGRAMIALTLCLSAAYFGAARLGLLLATVHGSVSPVWPATGLALAAVLLGGFRMWPAVFIGAITANAFTPVSLAVAVCIGVGNTLEAVAGAWLARRVSLRLRRLELDTLADAAALVVASAIAPVISATLGVLALTLGDGGIQSSLPTLWRTWWIGDALGGLVVAPLLIASATAVSTWGQMTAVQMLRAVAIFCAGAAVAWAVFFQSNGAIFLFAIFPVMLAAAAWLGSFGVKATALMISAIGVSAAFYGSGPFAGGSLNEGLLQLQLFLTSVAMAALVLPAFRAAGSLGLAGGVLLVMWLVSGWLFASLHQDRLRADTARVEVLVAEATASIRQRMLTYEDALRGGAGLLSAAKQVSRAEWGAYAQSVNLTKRYPGVQGIGVIFPVRAEDEAEFVRRMGAEGDPDFSIHDVHDATGAAVASSNRDRYVITYIEPEAINREAVGLDVASEAQRRTAAEISRDTGEPRITGRITLVQDNQRRPGFLLLMPIYRSDGPAETVAERRARLVAWIYSPFVTELFLSGVLGERPEIEVHAFLGKRTEISAESLVYASNPRSTGKLEFQRITEIDLAGQPFTLGWNRGPRFVPASQSTAVWAATSMALISLLVAGLVMSLDVLGARAREIAAQRTAELAASSERLKTLNAQLEQKNAEVRSFAHTASHDLREPLRAVQGFSEFLLEDFKATLPAAAQSMLERIGASTVRMSALIDNLLAYAEAESGALRTEPVDLASILDAVQQDLEPRIQATQGRIERRGALPMIDGDPTQLRRLFQNLLGNALKFYRPGVPPVVTVSAATVPARDNNRASAKISVSDNGIGFRSEEAERIFQPFDRLHGSSNYEGSGLGLAICKRVVERHGGEISASGTPGGGATFVFTLPAGSVDAVT